MKNPLKVTVEEIFGADNELLKKVNNELANTRL